MPNRSWPSKAAACYGINIRYYFGVHTSQNPACFPQQCEPTPQYCQKSIKCTQLGQPKFGALCNTATHHSSTLPTTSRQVLPSSPTWSTCQFRLATPKDTKPYLHSAQTRAHHKRTHTHAHTSAWPQLAPSEATEKEKRERRIRRKREQREICPVLNFDLESGVVREAMPAVFFSGRHTRRTRFGGGGTLLETRLSDSATGKEVDDVGRGHAAPTEIGAAGGAVPAPGLGMPGM